MSEVDDEVREALHARTGCCARAAHGHRPARRPPGLPGALLGQVSDAAWMALRASGGTPRRRASASASSGGAGSCMLGADQGAHPVDPSISSIRPGRILRLRNASSRRPAACGGQLSRCRRIRSVAVPPHRVASLRVGRTLFRTDRAPESSEFGKRWRPTMATGTIKRSSRIEASASSPRTHAKDYFCPRDGLDQSLGLRPPVRGSDGRSSRTRTARRGRAPHGCTPPKGDSLNSDQPPFRDRSLRARRCTRVAGAPQVGGGSRIAAREPAAPPPAPAAP